MTIDEALKIAGTRLRTTAAGMSGGPAGQKFRAAAAVLEDLRAALATAKIRSVVQRRDGSCFIQLDGSPALARLLAPREGAE